MATICFSKNRDKVEILFRDYMNHYLSETCGEKGLTYDSTKNFAEKDKAMNKLLNEEVFRVANINTDNMSGISVSMMAENPNYRWAAMAVSNSLVDMIIPEVLIRKNEVYTETRVGANGDTFQFDIEPNDLFYVSKAGRAKRTAEFQRQYQGTVTINPELRMISVSVDFYKVLAGKESLARYTAKVILSMQNAIDRDVYGAFDTAMAALPSTPVDGKLHLTGWDDNEAIKLAQTVSAFNGGQRAVFLGTPLALRHILPKDANYRYFLNDDYVRLGYIRNFANFDVMPLDQVADWGNPYQTVLNDNRIYVVSPSSQKIVKLCLEGDVRSNTMGHYENADLTSNNTVYKAWGVGIATNAIAGVIDLA